MVDKVSGIYVLSESLGFRFRGFHTEKNSFAEVSQNLTDTDLKIISLDYQNNYVGSLVTKLQKC